MRRIPRLPTDEPSYAERNDRWSEVQNVSRQPSPPARATSPPRQSCNNNKKSVRFASDTNLCSYVEPSNQLTYFDIAQLWWNDMELSPLKRIKGSPVLKLSKKANLHLFAPALDDELHERMKNNTFPLRQRRRARASLHLEDAQDIFEETEEDILKSILNEGYNGQDIESGDVACWDCRVPFPGDESSSLDATSSVFEDAGVGGFPRYAIAAQSA